MKIIKPVGSGRFPVFLLSPVRLCLPVQGIQCLDVCQMPDAFLLPLGKNTVRILETVREQASVIISRVNP